MRRSPTLRCAPSHALLWAGALAAMAACRGPSVEARAIWVDSLGGEDERRIHVYDRGRTHEILVAGAGSPIERVRLGPRGRSLLVRVGEDSSKDGGGAAWYDLEDGRRLPMWLPRGAAVGQAEVQFAAHGDALWWTSQDQLSLIPLAPGVDLEFTDAGNARPLVVEEQGEIRWVLSALDSSRLLVRRADGGVSFLSYPDRAEARGGLVREASFEGVWTPPIKGLWTLEGDGGGQSCTSAVDCGVFVGLDASGELAILLGQELGEWTLLDQAAPSTAIPLELPEVLAKAAVDGGGLGLLAVLDRSVSAWVGAGQLVRWDRQAGTVDSVAQFAAPPLWRFPVERGRGVLFLSQTGPMFRIDRERLEVINLETTGCQPAPGIAPVVSPGGGFAAWSCLDTEAESIGASGAVVRASRDGVERYPGVPMGVLAVDDAGDLLLDSFESIIVDRVDGVAPTSRPRSLFVLSREGALNRVDELEPEPAPVLAGAVGVAAHIQARAIE